MGSLPVIRLILVEFVLIVLLILMLMWVDDDDVISIPRVVIGGILLSHKGLLSPPLAFFSDAVSNGQEQCQQYN